MLRLRAVAGLSVVAALVALSAASCGESSGTGGSAGATGETSSSGAGGHCQEISADQFVRKQTFDELNAEAILSFAIDPGKVTGTIEFLDRSTTKIVDLGSLNESNYGTCTTCVLLTDRSGKQPRTFFQRSGKLDLGDTRLPAATGKLSDVTFVEVTVDKRSLVSTEVVGGDCLHLGEASFAFAPAPAGWLCGGQAYDDHTTCDCGFDCGAPDPDCKDPSHPINGCQAGQTCADGETCAGVPLAWTCDPADYAGGAGNGCQCGCGAYDPDCDLTGEAVVGCDAGYVCNHASSCVPPGWTCDPDSYADGYDCDCVCGLVDPDCADKHAFVVNCEYGQKCPADVCTGAPPDWTCDPADYAGGPGNGCNCGCGVYDPDCNRPSEAVIGCAADESCDFYTCYPNTWICDADRYDDGNCDCGCGAVDIDCADDTLASCGTCNNPGSCSAQACPGSIDPTNNAVCN